MHTPYLVPNYSVDVCISCAHVLNNPLSDGLEGMCVVIVDRLTGLAKDNGATNNGIVLGPKAV